MSAERPDAWTRALRGHVHGSARPHPLDAPRPDADPARPWAVVRDFAARTAGIRRRFSGDPAWVERLERVDAELAAPRPPARLDVLDEFARGMLVLALLADSPLGRRSSTRAALTAALAAVHARVGGPRFVLDYLSAVVRVKHRATSSPEAGYAVHYTDTDAGPSDEWPQRQFAASPLEGYSAYRRELFAAPAPAFAEAAGALRALLTAVEAPPRAGSWLAMPQVVYAFGRDRDLAAPWVRRALALPARVAHFSLDSLAANFAAPAMLACIADGALALALVRRWLADGHGAAPFAPYLADLVDGAGPAALPALDALAPAARDASSRKLLAALRPVAAAATPAE